MELEKKQQNIPETPVATDTGIGLGLKIVLVTIVVGAMAAGIVAALVTVR